MQFLTEKTIHCPYCGEAIEVFIDPQEVGHEYIEDCQVCCKPIIFNVQIDSEDNLSVSVRDENETY